MIKCWPGIYTVPAVIGFNFVSDSEIPCCTSPNPIDILPEKVAPGDPTKAWAHGSILQQHKYHDNMRLLINPNHDFAKWDRTLDHTDIKSDISLYQLPSLLHYIGGNLTKQFHWGPFLLTWINLNHKNRYVIRCPCKVWDEILIHT